MTPFRTIWIAVALLFVAQCGGPEGGRHDPIKPLERVSLILFSTPWCEPCELLLPDLDKKLKAASETNERVDSQLFVVTGVKVSQPPTSEIADAYKEKLKVSFLTAPDPWKWTNYKKYYGTTGLKVPGAVVLSSSGEVLKTFAPGTFIAEEVIGYLQSVAP